jgi:hypothetical protein
MSRRDLSAAVWDEVSQLTVDASELDLDWRCRWLVDAESFLWGRNFTMAQASAAVACEIAAYALMRKHLLASGGVLAHVQRHS